MRERLDDLVSDMLNSYISIHAPYEGATASKSPDAATINISIHAPYEGATILAPFKSLADVISIHAPYEGATR